MISDTLYQDCFQIVYTLNGNDMNSNIQNSVFSAEQHRAADWPHIQACVSNMAIIGVEYIILTLILEVNIRGEVQ